MVTSTFANFIVEIDQSENLHTENSSVAFIVEFNFLYDRIWIREHSKFYSLTFHIERLTFKMDEGQTIRNFLLIRVVVWLSFPYILCMASHIFNCAFLFSFSVSFKMHY